MYENLDTPSQKQRFRQERKRLSENHFNRAHTVGAWLLATLAATNLASAAAVLSFAKGEAALTAQPAFAFAVGVVAALLSGFTGAAEAHQRSSLYYLESCEPGDLSQKGKARLEKLEHWAPVLSWASTILNGLSLASFVVGAIWIARSTTI